MRSVPREGAAAREPAGAVGGAGGGGAGREGWGPGATFRGTTGGAAGADVDGEKKDIDVAVAGSRKGRISARNVDMGALVGDYTSSSYYLGSSEY